MNGVILGIEIFFGFVAGGVLLWLMIRVGAFLISKRAVTWAVIREVILAPYDLAVTLFTGRLPARLQKYSKKDAA